MKRFPIAAAIAICLPWLILFAPALVKDECFTLRDSGYYYYPMFQWNAAQWQQGEVPLWNPLENCGTPVVDDATASVFYPGQVLLLLPLLPFAAKYVLYVSSHVLIAGFGAYRLSRVFEFSWAASTLAAVSYAFGGSVLFQHCNVVFLVGAAWLPWAFAAGYRAIALRNMTSAWLCGAAMALMVLGGDPQSAYHTTLALGLLAILLWRKQRAAAKQQDDAEQESAGDANQPTGRSLAIGLLLVGLMAAIALLLSAVQILPSMQWSARSQRKVFIQPRSIYEIPEYLSRGDNEGMAGISRGLFGSPLPGTHHDHVYQFSNPPWSIAELFFPNVTGRIVPTHRRWSSKLPGVDRLWTPSLYLGLLPAMLAVCFFSLRKRHLGACWCGWLALLFAVASLGWYGLGWIIHEVAFGVWGKPPDAIPIGSSFGGLYWLMVKLLPGYVYFRYPAKLFVVAALGISMIAARGFDQVIEGRTGRLRVGLIVITALSVAGLILLRVFAMQLDAYFASLPADAFFGPLDIEGAAFDFSAAFWQTLILAVIVLALDLVFRVRDAGRQAFLATSLLLITIGDILWANHGLVVTGPADTWTETNPTARAIYKQVNSEEQNVPPRAFRGQPVFWQPRAWAMYSSSERPVESVVFERQTLFPKHQLEDNIAVVESFNSIAPYDYWAFMTVARTGGFSRKDGIIEPNRELLDAISTQFILLPAGNQIESAESMPLLENQDQLSFWKTNTPFSRCWITAGFEQLPELKSTDPAEIGQRTRQVLLDLGTVRDFRATSIIESDDELELPESWPAKHDSSVTSSCSIESYQPKKIVIQAELAAPGILVLNDYYYPGWQATIASEGEASPRQSPIYRTNRIMRGVVLPAGNHSVTFQYRPANIKLGAAISAFAWLLLLGLTALVCVRKRRRVQI